MKYIKKSPKIILGLFMASFMIWSCTKDFEELNTNPNSPVDVPAINIFTRTQINGINRQLGGWMQTYYFGNWCQQWSRVQYINEDRYQPRDMSGYMEGAYSDCLKNLTIVLNKTAITGETSLQAAAKILRAWNFLYLTDIWGDVPYSEALQGLNIDGTLTPKYDKQSDIYAALLAELEEANVLLSGTTINFGAGDLFYGGDPVKWKKLANSLKLRMLNRAAGTPWTFTYNMAGTQADVTTNPGAAALSTAECGDYKNTRKSEPVSNL